MVAPKLSFVQPIGQSVLRAIFDQPMRQLPDTAPSDPSYISNWSGLAIQSITRLSNVEFEFLVSPLSLGAHSLIAALTLESASGELIDPSTVHQTFTVSSPDLVIQTQTWTTESELTLTFTDPLALPQSLVNLALFDRQSPDALAAVNPRFDISGADLVITLSQPLTAGARYNLIPDRSRIVSSITGAILAPSAPIIVWGQGNPPTLMSASVNVIEATLISSDALGEGSDNPGWPLAIGDYVSSVPGLGNETSLGTEPSILKIDGCSFTSGGTVTIGVGASITNVTPGLSFVDQAASVQGAGNEVVGVGLTTLNKTSGSPYELAFMSPTDSMGLAGRRLRMGFQTTFTPSGLSYPLFTIMLLNTQISLMCVKQPNNKAVFTLYKGGNPVITSAEFDPTFTRSLSIVDGTQDYGGFLSISLDGFVILGAATTEVIDPVLRDPTASNQAFVLILGSPIAPTQTFSLAISQLDVYTYLTPGFRGTESRDLLDFGAAALAVTVGPNPNIPSLPGSFGTGRAAFGLSARYMEEQDTVVLIIGLDPQAPPRFTGSASLLTADGQVLDQTLVDDSVVMFPEKEISIMFTHPPCIAGFQAGVVLTFDSENYSVRVPVRTQQAPASAAILTREPESWYHQRLINNQDNIAVSFGPAVIIQTP